MIRAVVWKELREQGLIAVLLAVLGAALLGAAAAFADPPSPNAPATDVVASLGVGRLLALMLVATAGMVCGGALFAAEREAGTLPFLDALPSRRWALWRAKVVAGLALAAAVVAVLLAVVAVARLGDAAFVRRLVAYAGLAFAWGAFGSSVARTTLGAVGVAVPASVAAAVICMFPIYIFLSQPGSGMPRPVGWLLFEVLMLGVPLGGSAWLFTAPDRARAVAAGPRPAAGAADGRAGLGLAAVAWLTARQLRVTARVLSAFALGLGLLLLRPEMHPLFVWPALALTAGVLCGVTAFGDEQVHRVGALWAEYRLPVGRAWWVKVGIHLLLLVWLLFLLAAPGVLRAQLDPEARVGFGHTLLAAVFRSRLFIELGAQGWKYALVPAAYGFAFGHLCGLLFKKPVVACGVAAMLGGVGAAAWGPSLLAGGAHHWQVWPPAAAVLLIGRLLVRAWAADRAAARGPVLRLAGGGAAAALLLCAGLGFRVLEVPDDPQGDADGAFVAALPKYDENVGGNRFRAAAERYARVAAQIAPEPPRPEGRRPRPEERLDTAVRTVWPKDDPDLTAWLDRAFGERAAADDPPWPEQAAAAAALPVGMYEPPGLVGTAAATAAALDNAKRMGLALLGRGLQREAAGDPAAFPPAYRTAVALARSVRYGGGQQALAASIDLERAALAAADGWAGRQTGRADLLADAARTTAALDDPGPFDPRPHVLIDRYVTRATLEAPNQWLAAALDSRGRSPEEAAAEADLVALAWAVPWERMRTRRLVGTPPDGPARGHIVAATAGRPGAVLLIRGRSAADFAEDEAQLRTFRRAFALKAAVLAYQADRGRAPADPAELVAANYLPRLPHDPFADGRPFGYRVSDGRPLVGRPRAQAPDRPFEYPLQVGQVVLWSVGTDRTDQGGRVPPDGQRAEDLVFVVPAPPGPK